MKQDIDNRFDYETKFTMGPTKIKEEALIILREIRRNKLPFPLVKYRLSIDDLKHMQKRFDTYTPQWISRTHLYLKSHNGSWWLPSLFRDNPRQLITRKNDWWNIDIAVDYFTEYERIRAKKEYTTSMEDNWNDDGELLQAIISCSEEKVVNCETLREALFHGSRELSLFRATRCKGFLQAVLFDEFHESCDISLFEGKRWLDMSAGWGDRLYTACSLDMEYLGFDPNINLEKGHNEIIDYVNSNYDQRIVYKPFEKSRDIVEEYTKINGKFDIALCSPPFWIIERYNGPEQSTDNYKKLDIWLVEFLFTSLSIIWDNLTEDGYMCINIANVRSCYIVEPMQLFIEEFLDGCQWEGIITFSGRGTQDTPGSLFCWKKGSAKFLWNERIDRSLSKNFPELADNWRRKLDKDSNK